MKKEIVHKKSPLCHMLGQSVVIDGVRVGVANEIRYTESTDSFPIITIEVVVPEDLKRNMQDYGVFMDVMRANIDD